MQRARTASEHRSLRAMRYLFVTFAALVLLAGCQFGEPVSLFDDNQGIEKAIGALRERIGERPYVLSVMIASDAVTIRAQNNADRSRVDEWRLARVHMASFNWERVSGPIGFALRLVNPDLEANLFDLGEVDFTAANALMRAAVEHAALADKAKVVRIEIARQAFPPPRPASGEVRWTVDVTSERETAQIFADASGAIVGANVAGTLRAKALDIFSKLDLVVEAVQGFRFIIGPERVLAQVNVGPQAINFETTLAESPVRENESNTAGARRTYVWTINGLQRTSGMMNPDGAASKPRNAFSVDEANWAILPRLTAAAPAQLAMPKGRVTGIALTMAENLVGPPSLLWKIEVTDPNNQKGHVLADAAGAVKQVLPPQR